MSAVLILDEMPTRCAKCRLMDFDKENCCYYCVAPNKWGTCWHEVDIKAAERPDWCPLQGVETVKHGMWHEKMATFGDYVYEVCSVCGEERYMDGMRPDESGYNYCPNCGAKMGIEEEN